MRQSQALAAGLASLLPGIAAQYTVPPPTRANPSTSRTAPPGTSPRFWKPVLKSLRTILSHLNSLSATRVCRNAQNHTNQPSGFSNTHRRSGTPRLDPSALADSRFTTRTACKCESSLTRRPLDTLPDTEIYTDATTIHSREENWASLPQTIRRRRRRRATRAWWTTAAVSILSRRAMCAGPSRSRRASPSTTLCA